jgi:hypothetical protein
MIKMFLAVVCALGAVLYMIQLVEFWEEKQKKKMDRFKK